MARRNSSRDAGGQPGHPVGADADDDDHRGILRHTNCGSSRIATNNGRSVHGIHTVRRPLASARAVAAATCGGVLDMGAGFMPSVIRPIDESGPHEQQPHPRAVQRVGQAAAEPVQPRLRRAVDVVGTAHPHACHRREHDDRARPRRPHGVGQHGQQARLGNEVGVQHRRGMRGVLLGAGLVAEHPERQHRRADRAVVGHDRRHQRSVRGQVVGVELADVHLGRTGLLEGGDLLGEPVGAAGGQHHGGAGSQPPREFGADLAAAAENHDRSAARVIHGCDYLLR